MDLQSFMSELFYGNNQEFLIYHMIFICLYTSLALTETIC